MIKVDLVNNKGFQWHTEKNISVKGFLFDENNNYYTGNTLVEYFEKIDNQEKLKQKLLKANGLFTIIIQLNNSELLIANDIIRAFPIFYSTQNNVFYISDSIYEILKTIKTPELHSRAKNELLSSSYVCGSNTLIKNIFITQSGQISQSQNIELKSDFYFDYSTSTENNLPYEQQKKQLEDKFDKTIERLVISLEGRKAVIPLSGGFDSRFIACKLKELGYKNILCYSYGKWNNNQERETSQKVAKKLGFDWEFIEYNKKTVGNYLNDETFRHFWQYYSQLSTSPMFHDYFAIKFFKENSIITNDSIFIPGHSGDFLGGSQLYKNGNIKKEASLKKIARNIFKQRFLLTKLSLAAEKEIINNIYSQLQHQHEKHVLPMAYTIFEDWEIKENLSKYIANSAHIYDFFGYEYRLPFWDKYLVEYCKTIPYKYKFGKILFDDVLKSSFKKFDIDFDEGKLLTPREFQFYKIKKQIKAIIPSRIINQLKPKSDPLNYEFAQDDLVKELTRQSNFSTKNLEYRNTIFTHWYIMQIEKLLNKI